jgi:hydroxypyruvate isomerase
MPRFAANLTMMFNEIPFLERFDAAAKAGFQAVEFALPYAYEPQVLKECLDRNKLQLVLNNMPAGDWDGGERGIACRPDRVEECRAGVRTAIRYAKALGFPQLNCLAGIRPAGADEKVLRKTFVENLKFAAKQTQEAGVRLLTEPISTVCFPGFYLNKTEQALDILREVASDNLKIQYDIYHMQLMEGDLAGTLQRHLDKIGHIQIGDNPGRHEPGTGEINYTFLFDFLDSIGYTGTIGCEYIPKAGTVEGLGWFSRYRAAPAAIAEA